MDDIFKIVIWLVLIIAFRFLFGKKKESPKQTGPHQGTDPEREEFAVKQQSARTVDKEEYDILSEIESLFKTNTSQPTRMEQKTGRGYETSPTESEHESYEKTRSPEEYTSYERQRNPLETRKMDTNRIKTEESMTASEHSRETFIRKQVQPRQVDPAISKQAEAFEKFLQRKDSEINMAARIRSRLIEPASLKEVVILSEILKRPRQRSGTPAYRKTATR